MEKAFWNDRREGTESYTLFAIYLPRSCLVALFCETVTAVLVRRRNLRQMDYL